MSNTKPIKTVEHVAESDCREIARQAISGARRAITGSNAWTINGAILCDFVEAALRDHEESVRNSERERCAKIAETSVPRGGRTYVMVDDIAAAIRASDPRDEHRAAANTGDGMSADAFLMDAVLQAEAQRMSKDFFVVRGSISVYAQGFYLLEDAVKFATSEAQKHPKSIVRVLETKLMLQNPPKKSVKLEGQA